MTPNDANVLGKVFGGSLLALIDLTASATSSKYAGVVCVTAAFDRVDFHEAIEIGELVTLIGKVTYVGRTSIEVTIDVSATNLPLGITRHTNTARVTMVALKDGAPHPVPRLICESREEKLAFLAGRLRREMRTAFREEVEREVARMSGLADARIDMLLSAEPLLPQVRPEAGTDA